MGDEDDRLNSFRDQVNRDIESLPATHYSRYPPSYIRRKLVTAGFAKGLGDELQEILGWAKKSSYTGDNYKAGGDIIPINSVGESRRLMLSGDRPSALRAIFMMMYADNVSGSSAVGYVGPGGKYYLALRPSDADTPLRGGRRLRRFKKQRVTRKYIQKKRNTKKKRKGIQHKIKKRFSRSKKKISKNGSHYQKSASRKKTKSKKQNQKNKIKKNKISKKKIKYQN